MNRDFAIRFIIAVAAHAIAIIVVLIIVSH